jgi:hypothetical protein
MRVKNTPFLLVLALAAAPAVATDTAPAPNPELTAPPASTTGGSSYGDRNRGGPYGFYSYPRHRSVAGGSSSGLDRSFSPLSGGTMPPGNTHGSPYYGRDYGAPYFGGGYYDGGTYYRERRDR